MVVSLWVGGFISPWDTANGNGPRKWVNLQPKKDILQTTEPITRNKGSSHVLMSRLP